jgi:hypothetical protein
MNRATSQSRVLTLKEVGDRPFTVVARGVCYRYEAPGAGLTFVFDRLRWKWDELLCELTVTCSLAGAQTVNGDVVSQASFNVSNDRARLDRADRIVSVANLAEMPVGRLLEEACQEVLAAERSASNVISLHDVDDIDEAASLFGCDGITIDLRQISMFYGLPGSGKSLQAARTALELIRSGRRVGYVDFEWEPAAHRKRARLLYGPQFPDVRYIRLERPLAQEIDGLRRAVINDGWDYAVIDSVSFGVGGPPESAEIAAAFLQACRQLRIGLLLVAHQAKGEGGDRYPFGSVMWYAGGRDIYHFRRSNSEQATDVLVTAVTHRKTNGSALRPPIAIEYTFGNRIDVRQVNPASVEDIAPEVPIWQRLRHALQPGPRTIEDLASELGVKGNSITKAITRDEKAKVRQFIRLPDSRLGLLDQRAG